MEITEVRIKLVSVQNDKLRAFCSITLDDDFVVRDLKVIEGAKGPFVAMPSRKLTERCPRCSGKNHYRACYCNDCGVRLARDLRPSSDERAGGRLKLHADIAHPINTRCREAIQRRILEEYLAEIERAKDPNYRPLDLDVFDEESLGAEASEEMVVLGTSLDDQPAFDRGAGRRPGFEERGRRTEPPPPARRRDGDPRPAFRDPRGLPAQAREAREPSPDAEDNFGAGIFS